MDYSLIIIIALAIIGLLIGFLVSLAGGAGGVFYVPILILAFGVDARVAVATSFSNNVAHCNNWIIKSPKGRQLEFKGRINFRDTRVIWSFIWSILFEPDSNGST